MKLRPLIAVSLALLALSCRKDPPLPEPEELLGEEEILAMVPQDVINTAYYKDVFLDGGCELNPGIKESGVVINGRLPYALAENGFSRAEYFLSTVNDVDNGYTSADMGIQNSLISGSADDLNGVLLYPDGEPRFRLIYVFGGHSGSHGRTLGAVGRLRVRTFYNNGGSYVGSCAGAYLAGGYASGGASSYFNIWEGGNMIATGVSNSSIDIELVSDAFEPYFGPADHTLVTGVRHNGGGFMDVRRAPEGTEVIGRFLNQAGKNSSKAPFYGQPAVWAYKASAQSGRLVVIGSHPEDAPDGDILKLTSSMFRYAWDGSGTARVKGVLRNGELIPMTKGTTDNDPSYTAIGDRQCHHFVVYLPKGTESLRVELGSSAGADLELFLRHGGFAFPENEPEYSSAAPGGNQEIVTGPLEAGLWFVAVRCATTVTATEKVTDPALGLGRHFVYTGHTEVLNGVPYTITASW